jgi:hypothetical protein
MAELTIRSLMNKESHWQRCAAFCVGATLLVLFSLSLGHSDILAEQLDVRSAIDQAEAQGRLDEETALLYRIWAALDPERLPQAFARRPRRLHKSLTPLMLDVHSRWKDLSPQIRSLLLPYLQRPTEPGQEPHTYGHSYLTPAVCYDSPGGHFRIWYVTTTDDAPPLIYSYGDDVPDWIHLCAEVFDHVWAIEVDSLGYRPPPPDGPWYGQDDYGGDERYDVYVENLNRHYVYGYTQSELYVDGPIPRASTSYIVVDDDYASIYPTAGAEGLKVTAAHEFFHAIQFAYDTLEERFFMEISSTWMEDVVYDGINDYYYYIQNSGSIFRHPERSLTTFDGIHEYSACVWNHYLAKRHGTDMIREIWDGCISDAALDATEEALHIRGSDLPEALNEFAVWNVFTGALADTVAFYPEGNRYPQVEVYVSQIHSQVPVAVESVMVPPEPLGSSYVRFFPAEDGAGLAVEVSGDRLATWRASLLGVGPSHRVVPMSIDDFGHGKGVLADWANYDYAMLVMTPFNFTVPPVQYGYQARPSGPPVVATLGQNYPNPATGERTVIPFTVAGETEVTIRILTLDGRLVRELSQDQGETEMDDGTSKVTVAWDLTNASGRPVAAGIYLYQLHHGDRVETRKLAVVR